MPSPALYVNFIDSTKLGIIINTSSFLIVGRITTQYNPFTVLFSGLGNICTPTILRTSEHLKVAIFLKS